MPVNATKKVIVQGLRIALFVVLIVTALYVSFGRIAASALGSVQDDIALLLSNSSAISSTAVEQLDRCRNKC